MANAERELRAELERTQAALARVTRERAAEKQRATDELARVRAELDRLRGSHGQHATVELAKFRAELERLEEANRQHEAERIEFEHRVALQHFEARAKVFALETRLGKEREPSQAQPTPLVAQPAVRGRARQTREAVASEPARSTLGERFVFVATGLVLVALSLACPEVNLCGLLFGTGLIILGPVV